MEREAQPKTVTEIYERRREKQENKLRNTFNLCVAINVYRVIVGMGEKWMTDRQRLDRYYEDVMSALDKGRVIQEFELRVKQYPVRIYSDVMQAFRRDFITNMFCDGQLEEDYDWRRHIYSKTLHVIWKEAQYQK